MLSRASVNRIIKFLLVAVALNIVWQSVRFQLEMSEIQRANAQGAEICTFGPPHSLLNRFYIAMFLLVCFWGTRVQGLPRTLLTVVGLSGATLIYMHWWQYFFRILENSGASPSAIKNLAYLVDGNYLDLSIAGVIALLIAHHVTQAVLSLLCVVNHPKRA